jgi:hypothetical protein
MQSSLKSTSLHHHVPRGVEIMCGQDITENIEYSKTSIGRLFIIMFASGKTASSHRLFRSRPRFGLGGFWYGASLHLCSNPSSASNPKRIKTIKHKLTSQIVIPGLQFAPGSSSAPPPASPYPPLSAFSQAQQRAFLGTLSSWLHS